MAHLWLKDESEQWAVLQLEADAFCLTRNPPLPVSGAQATSESVLKGVLLRRKRREGKDSWVLISGRERAVRINGIALVLGVRVLRERDEIFVEGAGHLYFSTESLARVEFFPGMSQTLYCPRCKQEVRAEARAVKCPQCDVWYHQSEELPCWTYAEMCALCPQLTDLEAGYRWTPEGL